MKVYDCFIFNNELDLLKLRLTYLNSVVDYFVISESPRTLSGLQKPLYYKENKELFEDFSYKIIHLITPVNDLPTFEYESFQRNYIKEALKDCSNDDLIVISDVDEIVNLPSLLPKIDKSKPHIVELPMYYYWFNLKTNHSYLLNPVAPWGYIKNIDVGHRSSAAYEFRKHKIKYNEINTGWHFSYLFGLDIPRYQKKIRSFSHQEYNSSYYLDRLRIERCVKLGVDLYERGRMSFRYTEQEIAPLLPYIELVGLTEFIYKRKLHKFNFEDEIFLLKNIYPKKIVHCFVIIYSVGKRLLKTSLKKILGWKAES